MIFTQRVQGAIVRKLVMSTTSTVSVRADSLSEEISAVIFDGSMRRLNSPSVPMPPVGIAPSQSETPIGREPISNGCFKDKSEDVGDNRPPEHPKAAVRNKKMVEMKTR